MKKKKLTNAKRAARKQRRQARMQRLRTRQDTRLNLMDMLSPESLTQTVAGVEFRRKNSIQA